MVRGLDSLVLKLRVIGNKVVRVDGDYIIAIDSRNKYRIYTLDSINNKVNISKGYDYIEYTKYKNYYIVKDNDMYGIVKGINDLRVDIVYDYLGITVINSRGDLNILAKADVLYGVLDKRGDVVIPFFYRDIEVYKVCTGYIYLASNEGGRTAYNDLGDILDIDKSILDLKLFICNRHIVAYDNLDSAIFIYSLSDKKLSRFKGNVISGTDVELFNDKGKIILKDTKSKRLNGEEDNI